MTGKEDHPKYNDPKWKPHIDQLEGEYKNDPPVVPTLEKGRWDMLAYLRKSMEKERDRGGSNQNNDRLQSLAKKSISYLNNLTSVKAGTKEEKPKTG